jgi:ribose 5-phosphate isomerase A
MTVTLEDEKKAAARAAVGLVHRGMRVALGTGSTASEALKLLAQSFASEPKLYCVASSIQTESEAKSLGLVISELTPDARFDLMIDGADEITPGLQLTKGGGGALFREKFLARLTSDVVIIADHTKVVEFLGSRAPIPVEVVPFARPVVARQISDSGFSVKVRPRPGDSRPFVTDNHNEILDVSPRTPITDPAKIDTELRAIPGVVETGLFLGLAHHALIGQPDGTVREIGARTARSPD